MSEQKGKILGLGGVFLKSADQKRLSAWYAENLGIGQGEYGEQFRWRSREHPSREHVTAWSIFPDSSTYFDPSAAPFMINYIVDDLDAVLAMLHEGGVRIDAKRETYDYGRFAWIYDADDNKVELWEPVLQPSPEPVEVFQSFVTAVNDHNVEALTALMTADHVFTDALGDQVHGARALESGWRGYFAMCPDYWIRTGQVLAEGAVVLAAGEAGGTIDGIAWRTPAAWKAVVRKGKVAQWQVFADNKPVYEILARRTHPRS